MAKNLIKFPEADVAELAIILTQMQGINELMRRDQKKINDIKLETRVIADQTRSILERLEALA